jgi:hypothetical protein
MPYAGQTLNFTLICIENNNLTSYNHTKTTPSHHKKQQQPNKPKFQRKMNKQKQTGKTHKFNSKKFHVKSKQATR